MQLPRPRSGLSVLMGGTSSQGRLVHVPVANIRRNERQPRLHFQPEAIDELATSIAEQGVVQPIAVRELPDGRFEVIAGERRWLASQQAGLDTIPAVVHDVDESAALVMALVENVVREDLSPIETARAYARLIDECGLSVSEVAASLGKSRPAVANTLRLLELPDEVIDMVARGQLSEGHGRALLGLPARAEQRRLARVVADAGMSVRATEVAVRNSSAAQATPGETDGIHNTRPQPLVDPELEREVEELADHVRARGARIVPSRKSVRLELRFSDPADLGRAVEELLVAARNSAPHEPV